MKRLIAQINRLGNGDIESRHLPVVDVDVDVDEVGCYFKARVSQVEVRTRRSTLYGFE